MKYIITLFLLIFCNTLWSQKTKDLQKLPYDELNRLSFAEYKKGSIAGCIPYVEAGREKARIEFGVEDSIYLAYTNYLGMYLQEIMKFAEAEQLFLELNKTRKKVLGKQHSLYTEGLGNLALLYAEKLDRYADAEKLYLEALEIDEKIIGKESKSYSILLGNLASLYSNMGKYANSEALYLEAIRIREKILGRESPEYATILNNLAGLYRLTSNYSKAEPLLVEAKNIREKVLGKEHLMYAFSLANLASLYQEQKQFDLSEPLYLRALDIFEKVVGKEHMYYATVLNNLALLYKNTQKYEKAEPLYIESMKLRAKLLGKNNLDYAASLNNLSSLYHSMGEYKKEFPLVLEANSIYVNVLGKEDPLLCNNLMAFANFHFEAGRLDSAYQYCIKSLDANSASIDSNFTDFANLDKYDFYSYLYIHIPIKSLIKIFKKQYEETGDKDKLQKFYELSKAAMRLNERIRNNLSEEGDKIRASATNEYYVEQGIKSALLLEKDVYIQDAFSFAEMNKSVLLADAIKGNRAIVLGDMPDSLVEKEFILQKKMNSLKKKQFTAKTPEDQAKISSELNAAKLETDVFFASLKNKYPKYHALKYENIVAKVSDIQVLIDDKTMFLEYFLTDSSIYLFVVNKKELSLHPITIDRKELDGNLSKLRNALSNYAFIINSEDKAYRDYVETAHWFYKNLLEMGLKNAIGIENLIIVADGELGHLPFEAFLRKPAPQKSEYKDLAYLIKDFNVSYNYSATLFKENLTSKKTKNSGRFLACAASYAPVDSSLLKLRMPYFFALRQHLQPLPATQNEIKHLAENFSGEFLWGDSTNEHFFKENAHNYSIIHLAMHGVLEQKQPMLSSLAFTENLDSLEDNFLQAYEISKMKLNADLVVLSACETGFGKFAKGEGVLSIARSFMYAGVPSLLVSLWQVNDASTSIIMKHFYENLATGMHKDAALRKAKMDYIQNMQGIVTHPAFWSPFILIGNNQSIYVQKKGMFSWFWVVGGLGILGVVGWSMSVTVKK